MPYLSFLSSHLLIARKTRILLVSELVFVHVIHFLHHINTRWVGINIRLYLENFIDVRTMVEPRGAAMNTQDRDPRKTS